MDKLKQKLYDRAAMELAQFRNWLVGLEPEVILDYAYEYVTKSEILLGFESVQLSPKQLNAMLKSPTPLEDVYKRYEGLEGGRVDEARNAIDHRANYVLREEFKASRREER